MIYGKPLPRIDNILWLSKLVEPYPATPDEVRSVAKNWYFSKGTLEFMKLFDKDEVFSNRRDFINKAQSLESAMYLKRGGFIAATN